jgi:hypothetical protein
MVFDIRGTVPAPVGLHLELARGNSANAKPGNDALSADVLRSVPFRQMVEEAAQRVPDLVRGSEPLRERLQARRFSTPRDYAELAEVYAQLVGEGHRSPVTILARMYEASVNTMSARVQRARSEFGFLTEGTPGQSGGALTARARRELRGKK